MTPVGGGPVGGIALHRIRGVAFNFGRIVFHGDEDWRWGCKSTLWGLANLIHFTAHGEVDGERFYTQGRNHPANSVFSPSQQPLAQI